MGKAISISVLILLGIYFPAICQVQWEFEKVSSTKTDAKIIFKGSLEPGWHIYSQFIPDTGPPPTKFNYVKSKYVEPFGRAQEVGCGKTFYDELYEMNLTWYEGKIEFIQFFKVSGNSALLEGTISFMICNNELCMPKKQAFSIML